MLLSHFSGDRNRNESLGSISEVFLIVFVSMNRNESRGSISAVFLIVFVPMNRNESLGSISEVFHLKTITSVSLAHSLASHPMENSVLSKWICKFRLPLALQNGFWKF